MDNQQPYQFTHRDGIRMLAREVVASTLWGIGGSLVATAIIKAISR